MMRMLEISNSLVVFLKPNISQNLGTLPSEQYTDIFGASVQNQRCDLTFGILGKIFSRRHLKYFKIFPRNQSLTFHANLPEMSKPILWKKKKNINLSSAEFAQRVHVARVNNRLTYLEAMFGSSDAILWNFVKLIPDTGYSCKSFNKEYLHRRKILCNSTRRLIGLKKLSTTIKHEHKH